jgi:uncharacterized protein
MRIKIKKRTIYTTLLVILAIILFYLLFIHGSVKNTYNFEGNKFSYSQNRGYVDYGMIYNFTNDSIAIYKLNFPSRNFLNYTTEIYGLLFLPQGKYNLPGVVLLPGGGGTKEGESKLAMLIAQQNYTVITIDQRGIGETGGYYLSLEQDAQIVSRGQEPIQHLSVFDALRAFDVLSEMNQVDKNNIALVGESMGGRYALIATALDHRIKGFVGISTAGFHFPKSYQDSSTSFYLSIDPDSYVADIYPRKVAFIHGNNDSVISLESAQKTFSLAKEPKSIFIANGCNHGYCPAMHDELLAQLRNIFGK